MQNQLKAIYITMLVAIVQANIFAQMNDGNFGNEWINYSQSYYKIKIIEDGFYFIDKETLQRDINGMAQIPPQNFQLFYQGNEVSVYVHTINGQVEYIAFYAEKNKGELDVNLYKNPAHHLNPEYSLYTDTATYFLTWNNDGISHQYQNQASNFTGAPNKENYYIHKSVVMFNNTWNKGRNIMYAGTNFALSTFDYGEGYSDNFKKVNFISVPTSNIYPTGSNAVVDIRAYFGGQINHQLRLSIGNSDTTYSAFSGDSVVNIIQQISAQELISGSTMVLLEGTQGNNDKLAVSVVSIAYPRSFDFEGKSIFKFSIAASSTKKILEIENFNGGASNSQNVYLYDMTNDLRIRCLWSGGKVYAALPPSSVERDLVLLNENFKTEINKIQAVHFENYNIARGNYIIISHPSLYKDAQNNNPIFEYAIYRASTGYTPVVVSIEELYDQFAYGVHHHPMAIKNFANFIKLYWQATPPQYIFLIGKARVYSECRAYPAINNLVPTFGSPPSDNILVSANNSPVPVIPIGRLAAVTGDEVMVYLNKIRAMETAASDSLSLEHQLWRKRMIHLGGGAVLWEQNVLKNHLQGMQSIVEKGKFGAKVHSFFKEDQDLMQFPKTKLIDSLVNNGVAMITFLGHGSVKGFDYYLGMANQYKNKNKYPFIMALGCYNGTIYQQEKLISEAFVFEKEAGAAAYLSFIDAVTISIATTLSDAFYKHLSRDYYGAGIGTLLQQSLKDVTGLTQYNYSSTFQMGCQFMVFHGDPALKINYRNTADYAIDTTTIRTVPEVVTQDLSNFTLKMEVYNLGQYIDTTLLVSVIRQHPSGQKDTIYTRIVAPKHKSQVEIMVPVNGYGDFGLNQFIIKLDADNALQEAPLSTAEDNNTALYTISIGNPIVTPVFPKPFSIVNDTVFAIKAMTTNAFQTENTWSVELDTNKNFNSSFLLTTTIQNSSSMMEWTPSIALENNKVYYWRVQVMDANGQTSEWMNSSFIYISNALSEGWNQSHWQQYQENSFETLNLKANPLFQFESNLYEISANAGFIPDGIADENLAIYENGSKVDKCRCSGRNGVYVAVLDPNTSTLWTLPGGSRRYGAINCDAAGRTAYSFLFETESITGQRNLSSFVKDTIPDGHLVVLYTLNNARIPAWENDLVQHLRFHGATQIDSAVYTSEQRAYAIGYKKGTANYPYFTEEVGLDKTKVAQASVALEKKWYEGKMISPLIGPAQHWQKLEWKATQLENYGDSVSINLWGINNDGEKQLLYRNISTDTFNLTSINAQEYPYLQLVLNNKDLINHTAAQLNYWRVYGQMDKDVALWADQNYISQYSTTTDTILNIDLKITNMGQSTVDTVELEYTIVGSDTFSQIFVALSPSSSTNTTLNLPIYNLTGHQVLIAHVKPLQNEATLANNWAWLEFDINGNNQNKPEEVAEEVIQELHSYPNPFNAATQIEFDLNGELPEKISIEVYDTRGTLVMKNNQTASHQNQWTWAAVNQEGRRVAAGVYFVRIDPIYQNSDLENTKNHKVVKLIVAE